VTLNLIGSGGHATVVADVARRAGHQEIIIWADAPPDLGRFPPGTRYRAQAELSPTVPVLLAVGALDQRRSLRRGFPCAPPALLDPSAAIGHGVFVGDGTVVFAACVVNANARVGSDAILNTGCIVEHDCVVGANCHLSPGVRLAGAVEIGDDVHVGLGAVVLPGIRVGHRVTIGAGAVVTRNVNPGLTIVGIPAKPLSR